MDAIIYEENDNWFAEFVDPYGYATVESCLDKADAQAALRRLLDNYVKKLEDDFGEAYNFLRDTSLLGDFRRT